MASCQFPASPKDSATSLTDSRPKGARHRHQKSLASLDAPQQSTTLLELTKDGPLSTDRLYDFLTDILGALKVLHRDETVHGSIRLDTLFLDSQGSFVLPPLPEAWPEVELEQADAKQFTTKTLAGDVFAVGYCLQYLATGLFTVEDGSNRLSVSGTQPVSSSVPQDLQDLIQNMLAKPDERWSAETCHLKAVAASFAQAKPSCKISRSDTANLLQLTEGPLGSCLGRSLFTDQDVQDCRLAAEQEPTPTYPHNLTTPFAAETVQEKPLIQARAWISKAIELESSGGQVSGDIGKDSSTLQHTTSPSKPESGGSSPVFLAAISGLNEAQSQAYLAELQQLVAAEAFPADTSWEQENEPAADESAAGSGTSNSSSSVSLISSTAPSESAVERSQGRSPGGMTMQRSMALNLDDLGIF